MLIHHISVKDYWNIRKESKKQAKEEQSEVFFSKSQKYRSIALAIFFCILIFLAIFFLLDVKWDSLGNTIISKASSPRFLFTVIFSLSLFIFNDLFLQLVGHKLRTGKHLQHIKLKDWLGFILTCLFIQTITPFSLGSETFIAVWYKKNGMSHREAYSIVAVTTFSWLCAQFLITWPSFLVITYENWDKIQNSTINKAYWFILIGLFVDLVIWLIIFLMGYSKHVHYFFAKTSNLIKKWMHLDYIVESELIYQYLINDVFKRAYLNKLKSRITVLSVMIYCLQNFLVYMLYAMIFTTLKGDSSIWSQYHFINTAMTANNFSPTPSSEGSLQITIKALSNLSNDSAATSALAPDNGIVIWRFFAKYLGALVAFIYIGRCGLIRTTTPAAQQTHKMWDTY